MGFATKLVEAEEKEVATQSIRKSLMQKITKGSEKVAAVNVNIDKEELETIIQTEIKKLEQKLINQKDFTEKNKEPINKPLEMMKDFFNAKK